MKCTTAENRNLQIHFRNDWIQKFRKRMKSPAGIKAMRKRKAWAEHPFGTLKTWMGKIPLKVRGKSKVQTEIDLYTTAYNFRRLVNATNYKLLNKQIARYNWMT